MRDLRKNPDVNELEKKDRSDEKTATVRERG